MGIDSLLDLIKNYAPKDKQTVINAYRFASEVHQGVMRKSGEPYITHPIAVACILAEMQADVETIVAGLLHDTIEDGEGITKELISEKFGDTVANLVDGVTNLPKLSVEADKYKTDAASKRKIYESISFDIRILIIKLADRLHNMRTLEYHRPEKQIEKANETIKIYAPFATLIGSYTFKQELEDLSFKYLNSEEYNRLVNLEKEAYHENYDVIEDAICQVSEFLNNNNIPFTFKLKIKNIYGLYKRLQKYQDLARVHDLFSLKFMVNDEQTCYYLRDEINNMFPVIRQKEKDYIAHPKNNMYKSLHTSVLASNNRILQFQVKTNEMYLINAYGLTAYWDLLKLNNATEKIQSKAHDLYFMKILEELKKANMSNEEFNMTVQNEILKERMYIRTPKGDIIDLPVGSTPVDFAFKVHTDLGLNMVAAKVNGVDVPLDFALEDKDVVEIITDPNYTEERGDIYEAATSESVKRKIKKYREDNNF